MQGGGRLKYEPYRHQQIAYDFGLSHPHCGLFLGMGLGKTVTSLSLFVYRLWDEFSVRKCLVIAPKNVAANVWAQECRKWDHLQDIRCSVIMGTAKQRLKALQTDADLYITNRDNVVWLLDQLNGKLPFDMVILDELSSFKSVKAQRWKALKKAIQSVPYVLGLTGTPAPNGYLDLWPQIFLLDGGQRLGARIGQYRDRYFRMGAHKGHVVYEWRLRVGAKEAIDRKLQDLCISMASEDWLDLPPVIYNTVPCSMDATARKRYDALVKDKVIPLLYDGEEFRILDLKNDEELEQMTSVIKGDTAAAIRGKLLQMANGAAYDDVGGVLHIHDAKLDALSEIVDTNPGENILVFYAFRHDRDRILNAFPKAKQLETPEDTEAWNRGEIPMLLCHPASAGHGLNLQHGGHITVWFGLPDGNLELYQQANARLARPGQKESVIIHHIVCRDTVDETLLPALQQKSDVQKALLQALRPYLDK